MNTWDEGDRLTDYECLQLQLDAIHNRTARQTRFDTWFNRRHVERCWPDTLARIDAEWRTQHPKETEGIPDYAAIATRRALAPLRRASKDGDQP